MRRIFLSLTLLAIKPLSPPASPDRHHRGYFPPYWGATVAVVRQIENASEEILVPGPTAWGRRAEGDVLEILEEQWGSELDIALGLGLVRHSPALTPLPHAPLAPPRN